MEKDRQRESLSSPRAAKLLESKDVGVDFAALNNVPVLYSEVASNAEDVLHKIKESRATLVVKPLIGWSSRDVFIFFSPDDIFDIGRNRQLNGFNEFKTKLGTSNRPGWLLEPFLASENDIRCPAHDLKFYSFYGEVGIVLEVVRHPEVRYCWWNPYRRKYWSRKAQLSSF